MYAPDAAKRDKFVESLSYYIELIYFEGTVVSPVNFRSQTDEYQSFTTLLQFIFLLNYGLIFSVSRNLLHATKSPYSHRRR
jgi:hypothetical protein